MAMVAVNTATPKPRRRRPAKQRLIVRPLGRVSADQIFDRLYSQIVADLGGASELSAIARTLVEGYIESYLTLRHLSAKRRAADGDIDIAAHAAIVASTVSTMVRAASRLGTERRAKTVDNVFDYIASKYPPKPAATIEPPEAHDDEDAA